MLDTIRKCDQVTWILCTKRPELWKQRLWEIHETAGMPGIGFIEEWVWHNHPPQNIILLTSVENQKEADKRIPDLLKIPAVCRGLSLEPLLGPVDLRLPTRTFDRGQYGPGCDHCCNGDRCDGPTHFSRERCPYCRGTGQAKILNWLIIGGESGPGSRPCNVEWIRSIVKQGKAAGVATFVKQLGAAPTMPGVQYTTSIPVGIECKHGRDVCPECDRTDRSLYPELKHLKGGEPSEWPEDLRVQQCPKGF